MDYTKETVFVQDNMLKNHGLLALGVMRREKEVHVELYLKDSYGNIFHRELEVKPDGTHDGGCLIRPEDIKKRLKDHNIKVK